MSRGFKILDHTADIGLEVWGEDFNSVFEEAASGLFGLMANLDSVAPKTRVEISLKADGGEQLFLAWLKELLFISETKRMIFSKFHLKELTFDHLKAEIFGEEIDSKKHSLGREVKAVTHHQFEFTKTAHGFRAQVILDI